MQATKDHEPVFTHGQLAALSALEYKTPYLERLLAERADLDDDFCRHLFEITEDEALAYNRVMCAHDGDPSGVEHKHHERRSWAFVLPDASEPGKHRVQYFDHRGFYSHQPYDSMAQAAQAMVAEGYHMADPGALDRLAGTQEWLRGTEVAALVQLVNARRITLTEFNERVAAL